MKFAKIIENKELGQILVLRKLNDVDFPELRFLIDLEQFGLGVCETSMTFKEGCEGARDQAFDKVDEEIAVEFINSTLLENLREAISDDNN